MCIVRIVRRSHVQDIPVDGHIILSGELSECSGLVTMVGPKQGGYKDAFESARHIVQSASRLWAMLSGLPSLLQSETRGNRSLSYLFQWLSRLRTSPSHVGSLAQFRIQSNTDRILAFLCVAQWHSQGWA